MHAADVRSLYIFKDKRVLSIGSSYSSESVVLEAYKHGCKRVVNSYRTNGIGFIRESQSEGIAAEHPILTDIEVIVFLNCLKRFFSQKIKIDCFFSVI